MPHYNCSAQILPFLTDNGNKFLRCQWYLHPMLVYFHCIRLHLKGICEIFSIIGFLLIFKENNHSGNKKEMKNGHSWRRIETYFLMFVAEPPCRWAYVTSSCWWNMGSLKCHHLGQDGQGGCLFLCLIPCQLSSWRGSNEGKMVESLDRSVCGPRIIS